MNSERKAFEEWASSETGWDLYWSDHINQYMDHHTNGAWLAWQASTQRQGYKLVPVDPTEKMQKYGNRLALSDKGYRYDCASIYEAMIVAADD